MPPKVRLRGGDEGKERKEGKQAIESLLRSQSARRGRLEQNVAHGPNAKEKTWNRR